MQTCATSRLQVSAIVLCGRSVRWRAGPAPTRCAMQVQNICNLSFVVVVVVRQRVRQGARMKEAFIRAQPICCYPALIEHKSQQLACWDNKSLSGLETWFKPHVKSASLERAVNHTELSMQINFSKVFTSQGTFKKIPSIVS